MGGRYGEGLKRGWRSKSAEERRAFIEVSFEARMADAERLREQRRKGEVQNHVEDYPALLPKPHGQCCFLVE